MHLKPNRTILDGTVERIDQAANGWGADVVFRVRASQAADGFEDFIGAQPGAALQVFAAEPEAVRLGGRYRLTATVLGGPGGERVVLEEARALADGG